MCACVCVYIVQPFTFTNWDLTDSIVLKKGKKTTGFDTIDITNICTQISLGTYDVRGENNSIFLSQLIVNYNYGNLYIKIHTLLASRRC